MKKYLWVTIFLLMPALVFSQATYKSYIGKEDVNLFDGITNTFEQRTSAGESVTLHKIGYEVDVAQVYGLGMASFTALKDAINQLSGSNVELLLSPGTWTISSDLTIPSNFTLHVPAGAIISISSGKSLTINGKINAGEYQIFSGSGLFNFASGLILKSSWFSSFETAVTKIGSSIVTLEATASAIITTNCVISITTSLFIRKGVILTVLPGKTLTINGSFKAGLYQVFGGTGIISFGTGSVSRAYPQWWGGIADHFNGAGTDNSSAINAALASGAKTIFLTNGDWGISSSLEITKTYTVLEGESMIGTQILPLSTSLLPVNAIIVIKVQPLNGAIKNIRFNSSVAYTGWAISAIRGVSGQLNLFSTELANIWCAFPSTASGFFTGGLYDSWVHDCQFENLKHRFYLVGTSSCGNNTFFTNINDISGRLSFITATVRADSMVLNGITSRTVIGSFSDDNYFITATNAENWKISNIDYQGSNTKYDPVGTSYIGFAKLTNCLRMSFSNVTMTKVAGTAYMKGFYISGSEVKINNCFFIKKNNSKVDPIKITGLNNKIWIDDICVEGGAYDQVRLASPCTGDLEISNSYFTKSSGRIIRNEPGTTPEINIKIKNSTLINGQWGVASPTDDLLQIGTNGTISLIGNTMGRDTEGVTGNASNPSALIAYSGSDTSGIFTGNRIIGFDLSSMYPSTIYRRIPSHIIIGNAALADDAIINLPNLTSGVITVHANGEVGIFIFTTSGTVKKISGTSNTADSDSDGYLCVYADVSGTFPVVKNRLGRVAVVSIAYQYI